MGVETVEKELQKKKEDILKCRAKISEADKTRATLLHDLETRNADAVALVKLAKELRTNEQMRRVYKTLLHEAESDYNFLGGDKQLQKLKSRREAKVRKTLKRNSWFDHFTPEAMNILKEGVV